MLLNNSKLYLALRQIKIQMQGFLLQFGLTLPQEKTEL